MKSRERGRYQILREEREKGIFRRRWSCQLKDAAIFLHAPVLIWELWAIASARPLWHKSRDARQKSGEKAESIN